MFSLFDADQAYFITTLNSAFRYLNDLLNIAKDKEIPQSHTAYQPTAPEEELKNIYGNNTSVRQ